MQQYFGALLSAHIACTAGCCLCHMAGPGWLRMVQVVAFVRLIGWLWSMSVQATHKRRLYARANQAQCQGLMCCAVAQQNPQPVNGVLQDTV